MKKEELFEIIGEADDKKIFAAEKIAFSTKKRRFPIIKWSAVAACICVLLVSVSVAIGERQHPDDQIQLIINEAKIRAIADIDCQIIRFDELSKEESESFLKEFEAATKTCYSAFTSKIPDTFVCESFYLNKLRDFNTENEYIPHDYVFEYACKNGGNVRIALCSVGYPLRCVVYGYDFPLASDINGVQVYVYRIGGGFWVQFSKDGVNYDVEATNISAEKAGEFSQDDLIDLLNALTK